MIRPVVTAIVLYSVLSTPCLAPCAAQAPPQQRPPQPPGPLEILENYNIGPGQFEAFISGQPLTSGEQDLLVKLLYHFPRLGLDNLQRWRQRAVNWDELAAAPVEHRLHVFRVEGRVKHVEVVKLSTQQAELYELDHYYRVRMTLADSSHSALVISRRIPEAWQVELPLDEPAQADAIFLKTNRASAHFLELLFVAGSMGWFPDRPDQQRHIGPSQLALAKLGMDISLWDDIQKSKDRGLGTADREGFYQLLAALGRDESGRHLLASTTQPLTGQILAELLDHADDHFGDSFKVEALARRVMRVPVSDADIRSRFGIDHYYEVDLFLPLGEASLRFGNDPSGEKNPVYRNKFPATLIVRDLPRGFPQGETVHELVRANGVFFKTWSYRSGYTTKFGHLQPSPLLIAPTAQVVPVNVGANWITSGLVVVALAIALGVVVTVGWVYRRDDRQAREQAANRTAAESRPDFSQLG